jgi:curved DNA-binding protein CbpA
MSSPDLENVAPHSSRADTLTLEIELSKQREKGIFTPDYYEILRVDPQAHEETIERVYRTLAERFHPDNPGTGDAKTFERIREAYDTLSDQAKRAEYNALRQHGRGSTQFWLRGREFFDGVKGGQNRRLAVLCLLYRQRISTHESPGLTILDLEQLTGCTREELTAALWYLCEKQWATLGDFMRYSISAAGFDVVESNLENRLEFRALATLPYYGLPSESEDPRKEDPLPFEIGPPITSEGDVFVADHYEILGIGPKADEETIERVYGTLADRFHPDNPGTGDAKTFEQIREAYDTLSNRAKRAQYNTVRERTKYSERFRLRGRDFFDGIKGEQLRRLAVLSLLYRQAASELPGLTVLDMEQLTGCTREELGSALWYLREKKWAKSGEFTEYTITAAGFDVVEKKLDDREAAKSRHRVAPENARGSEFMYQQLSAAPAAGQGQQDEPVTAHSPTASITTPENQNSHWIVDSEQTDIKGEEPPDENVVAAQGPIPIEEASGIAEQATRFEAGAEPLTNSQENGPITPQSPGVSDMSNSTKAIAEQAGGVAVSARKRVIFSMGGKGGVGKTSVMTGLAEWFEENRIPVTLLDLDIENKAKGSLAHFFDGRVPKINIHTPAGLDSFVDILAEEAPAILADMGAGAGQITHDWFHKMYPDVTAAGVVFTAIGVVTSDPASVESVLNWAAALEDRVAYVIVENNLTVHTDFTYWREGDEAEEFRKRFQPAIIQLDYRIADLENAARNYGVTLGRVARRTTTAPELQKASLVMRAQSARRRMFEEFDKVKELLLP